jgi:cytochrome c peroxidase
MKRRTKIVVLVVVALGLLVLFPISNLLVGTPAATLLTRASAQDARTVQVAHLLGQSCASCHVAGVPRPYYAKLPLASRLIEHDVSEGLRQFDLAAAFPADAAPAPEPVLAKIEDEIVEGEMPPLQYAAMHWNAVLGSADKQLLLAWIKDSRARQAAPGTAAATAGLPIRPLPASVPHDPRKAALGEKLYHDKRLSGDDTLSCASCHDLGKGGTDQQVVSDGIRGAQGGINSPTTFNAALGFVQFWDGRAPTLEAQAAGPPMNPVEMGSAGWDQIVAKLNRDAAFRKEFEAVYAEGFNEKTITSAIAEFERTLVTPDSRFDRYLAGDETALNASEQRGYELFKANRCATCHVGELLGGKSFERMGRHADYFATRGTPRTAADDGRYNVTKLERDRHLFKVPTLRNVARTAPYFHDGSRKTLREAVDAMAVYQSGRPLTAEEADDVVRFLGTLTGEYQGKPL